MEKKFVTWDGSEQARIYYRSRQGLRHGLNRVLRLITSADREAKRLNGNFASAGKQESVRREES